MALSTDRLPEVGTAYARLEEQISSRDQGAASDIFYDLVRAAADPRAGRRDWCASTRRTRTCPTTSASTTACVRFVNNDHCLLSARAGLRPDAADAARLRYCRWRRPSGICPPASIPGTSCSARRPATTCGSTRSTSRARRRRPRCTGPTRRRSHIDGHVRRAAQHWLTLVQRGEVDRRLPRLPRPVRERGRTGARAAGPARVRRPDRRAGPHALQPLLHHRPQVLSRPRHRRAGARRWAGRTRTASSTRACPTSRWGRAGTRPTRWPARWCQMPARQPRPRAARQRRRAHPGGVARAAAGDAAAARSRPTST